MSNSSAIQVRRVREATAGTLPAGNMTIVPFATFKPSSGLTRTPGDNVNADRQPIDNPATDFQTQLSATSDWLLDVYDGIREEVFCNAVSASDTLTNSTIAAVASGNKLTKTGTWTFAVGSIVLVSGFTTNPDPFVAIVTDNSTTDLTLDTPHGSLVDEAAGASITVQHTGQHTLGTTLYTASYETWNTKSSKGDEWLGVGASSWGIGFDFPGHFKQQFNFRGMRKPIRLSAQLANASTNSSARRVVNSNVDFGAATLPDAGMGFRYGGALTTDLIITKLQLSVENPLQTFGGAGVLGPQGIALDADFTIKLDLTAYRQGTDIDDLIDDAQDPDSEIAIGFGVRDPDGNLAYIYLPNMQPTNGVGDGQKKSGLELCEFSYMARKAAATHGAIRYARLGTAP